MSSPMEALSPPPTIVAYEAENEERSPSPGGTNNTGPMPIAIDGEGGIPYVKRLVAQVGSGRPGKDTEVELLVNQQSQSGPLETHSPVNPNPIPPFLPAGTPIHDPLVFASQLAQHYSEPLGQAPLYQYVSH